MKFIRFFVLISLLGLSIPAVHAQNDNHALNLTVNYQTNEPVTLDLASGSSSYILDPTFASDSNAVIENLFLGLTDLDPFTGEIKPELATHWDISDDGMTWTFYLRGDIYWYHYDPSSESAEAVRPVVAQDVIYGIKRACDPRFGGYYDVRVSQIIEGCDVVNDLLDSDVSDELAYGETIRVQALDDLTVEIKLKESAGYFLSITIIPRLRPVPQDVIEEYGDAWTLPENILTNGPYFIHENTRGIRQEFVRNWNFNADLWHGGNIDRINITHIEDLETRFAFYEMNEFDTSTVTDSWGTEVNASNHIDEVLTLSNSVVYNFGFNRNKPPFDNVHVRRAFSAIIDREQFIIETGVQGVPMIHFTPPNMLGAPPIDEVGFGFNPEYAQAQLALAGYPNCEGFPSITFMVFSFADMWANYVMNSASRWLNCDSHKWTVKDIPYAIGDLVYVPPTPTPEEHPNIFTGSWGSDYLDSNAWLQDRLHCNNIWHIPVGYYAVFVPRPCTEIDTLIEQAAQETDQTRRAEMYREIEESFFGEEGEFPIIPLYMGQWQILVKPWYTGPFEIDLLYGGQHWDAYTIDMEAKLTARQE